MLLLLAAVLAAAVLAASAPPPLRNSMWAVHIPGGPAAAVVVARETGAMLLGPLGSLKDIYHFQAEPQQWWQLQHPIEGHHHVAWALHQELRGRVKREWVPSDPQFGSQWYLQNTVFPSLHVLPGWNSGINGSGVVITIVDDGLERLNLDLSDNYDPAASYDFNGNDADPTPRYDPSNINSHGTRCAGTAAAASNKFCGTGIAFGANIGGIRMLDEDTASDAVEGGSLSFRPNVIDIYSCSWGPFDDGQAMEGPGPLAAKALHDGVASGREGLGSIFVWASGNGGLSQDNCNADGYANSIYTIAIGAIDSAGEPPFYSEMCAALMGSTFSSGSAGLPEVTTCDTHDRCTNAFTGTSAAAPMAAGLFALVLQAHPCLSWRDLQNLIALNADPSNLRDTFARNGAGLAYSHRFGFGLIRADRLISATRNYTTMAGRLAIVWPLQTVARTFTSTLLSAITTACDASGTLCIEHLEHITVSISITGGRRGDLALTLTSPSGTRADLLTVRPPDNAVGLHWTFMTTACWGERGAGTWTLQVLNAGSGGGSVDAATARIDEWGMVLHGTAALDAYNRSTVVAGVPYHSHACTICPPDSFPDGSGQCRKCDSSCGGRCVAPGPAGCAANFEVSDLYAAPAPVAGLTQRQIVAMALLVVVAMGCIGYCVAARLRQRQAGGTQPVAAVRYVAVGDDIDDDRDGSVLLGLPTTTVATPAPANSLRL